MSRCSPDFLSFAHTRTLARQVFVSHRLPALRRVRVLIAAIFTVPTTRASVGGYRSGACVVGVLAAPGPRPACTAGGGEGGRPGVAERAQMSRRGAPCRTGGRAVPSRWRTRTPSRARPPQRVVAWWPRRRGVRMRLVSWPAPVAHRVRCDHHDPLVPSLRAWRWRTSTR
ncbi:hypothetical protein ABB37_02240 [Leptomonas pyrrhocoris]|uniref:Uncharacterized protein n=1 Tax=Leptomonas pyrrhocoris TaxID=157538 RepID=A0A0M9G7K3_LEPPY|nr:hypothetical protein ABB37_02240 [Leptomonas pyrrhocoris]KPA84173.1 hypothetical protein ABB37_02240 [Leptomonas pyrrhocoris]|eukprot:XP_015662612.1 hypothetical protein ABB37_02240 [Leptomonas pyrrhocoris]